MIRITSDLHGDINRLSSVVMEGEQNWTKDDILIVCGDFGFIWDNDEYLQNQRLKPFSQKPYTVLFVDGNHENFTELEKYPIVEKYGAPIRKIRENVYHLCRGYIYTIEGKTFFTFGGAYSIDKYMREENYSWWRRELPSNEEYHRGIQSIREAGYKVDYIITHTAPQTAIRLMGHTPDSHDAELTGFLDWVMCTVKFTHWYFGHWHCDRDITDKLSALYFDIKELSTN